LIKVKTDLFNIVIRKELQISETDLQKMIRTELKESESDPKKTVSTQFQFQLTCRYGNQKHERATV
jgi:hypothetical protein